jgi:glycosyltransferase involved in cell wall biosynthesis
MKVSIVTAYHNRKQQFLKTLQTISNSSIKDLEVVVVDDASDDEHRLEDVVNSFPFKIKLIRKEKSDRWYKNPCIPFNEAIKESSGEIIILQNPECAHVGDVVESVSRLVSDGYYLVFNCYSIPKAITDEFIATGNINSQLPNKPMSDEGDIGWYHHPNIRPTYYHFCSAITRKDLINIGCFDELFAHGLGYDDDDLVRRIESNKLKILSISNGPMVIHQYHYHLGNLTKQEKLILSDINRKLYEQRYARI